MFLRIQTDAFKSRSATVFILLLLTMSKILTSEMLIRVPYTVSKLHNPCPNHIIYNMDILKRWTSGRISSKRVSQLHEG
jgi:hypothetical protein